MLGKAYFKSTAAGIFSAGIFLIIFGLGAGIPFMLLPSLPLFALGLHRHAAELIVACGVATLLVLTAGGFESGMFYGAFIVIPVLLFAPAAITHRNGHLRPVGELLTDLAIYAALIYAAMIVYYSSQGGLQQQIAGYMKEGFADADPQTQTTMEAIGGTLAFLILAASAWWWVLLTYAHAIIANGLLATKARKERASLALAPFTPSPWLLLALTVCGAASLSGWQTWAFMAQTLLLILLLPYFLLGLTLVQERLRNTPGRGMILFMLYFFTLSLVWPALIIAAAGVWMQCRTLAHPPKA